MSKWMPIINTQMGKLSNDEIAIVDAILDKTHEYSNKIDKEIEELFPKIKNVLLVSAVRILKPLISGKVLHTRIIHVKLGEEAEYQLVTTIDKSIRELLYIASDEMIMAIAEQIISEYSTITFNALINDRQFCLPRATLLKFKINDKGNLEVYTPKFIRVPLPYENYTMPYDKAMIEIYEDGTVKVNGHPHKVVTDHYPSPMECAPPRRITEGNANA